MRTFIIQRVLLLFPTLLGISAVVFFSLHAIPGDPIEIYLGVYYDEATAAALRSQYGLDQPLLMQYLWWLGRLVKGDWGVEVLSGDFVFQKVLEHGPVSLELIVGAMLVAILIALPVGILSATKPYTSTDHIAMTGTMLGVAIPEFFGGILLVLFFSLFMGWFPVQGFRPWSDGIWTHLSHIILPCFTLGFTRASVLARMVRSCMLDVVNQDYIRTCRAKGIPEFVVINKHALKNALIPVVTVMGLQVGFLVGGTIVVETVFSIPGLGQYGINAIAGRDYPAVMGFIVIVSSVFILVNLAVDIAYALLDPRIRHER